MSETKLIRVYIDDEDNLIELRRDLTREKGEQVSFADVIKWLIATSEEFPNQRRAKCLPNYLD